jgi:hypothetical protein
MHLGQRLRSLVVVEQLGQRWRFHALDAVRPFLCLAVVHLQR